MSKPVSERELEAVLGRWVTTDGGGVLEQAEPEPAPYGDGVLDGAQFEGLRELAAVCGDPGFLGGLVDRYLEQSGSQLGELREAAAREDAPALRELAHGLRGASATMGARGVASACAGLEKAAAQGRVAGAQDLARVAAELERATAACGRSPWPGTDERLRP